MLFLDENTFKKEWVIDIRCKKNNIFSRVIKKLDKEFIPRLKSMGYDASIDNNGYVRIKKMEYVKESVEWESEEYLLDVKDAFQEYMDDYNIENIKYFPPYGSRRDGIYYDI